MKPVFDEKYFSSGWYSNYLKNYKKLGNFEAKRLVEVLKPKNLGNFWMSGVEWEGWFWH